MTKTSDIFNVADSADKVVCPPAQVFKNQGFEFLLTAGGHLVEDDAQYDEFMKLLKELGERRFTIRDNLGASLTDRKTPLDATFSVNSDLKEFDAKFDEFDEHEHGAMSILHWFVHGQSKDWGIYVAEFPTVNIIGCESELTEKFRKVFRIEGNGYDQEKEFLNRELKLLENQDDMRSFFENYKLGAHYKDL